jgi:Class II Aldolase and Adducin N-terminal domain
MVAVHTGVYRARPQAGAVIHTHSPWLLAFALAARPLPARYEPLPCLGQAEEVPVVPAGSVSAIIELIGERSGTQAVLLGGTSAPCPGGAGSASSTGPTTRRCSSSGSTKTCSRRNSA